MTSDALREEQAFVSAAYGHLDRSREESRAMLAAAERSRGGTPQGQSEREAFAAAYRSRLAQLLAVDSGLCFGRLDPVVDAHPAGESLHIGRIGLTDGGHQTVLVDWRAPAAEAFYRATAAHPLGIRRRRHLRTREREVIGVDDEVFDLDALSDDERLHLSGEGALLAALGASRTGRMRDVVATLQAEQDRIVRAPREGVLVVQGGPGTGKTVVALHRAAYLLYTYRDRLAGSGVLIVGPGRRFLHYVSEVLPSLGETAVILASIADLFPGVTATATDRPRVAALKGDPRMPGLLAAAVADRRRMPERTLRLRYEGTELALRASQCAQAQAAALRSRRPHNEARNVFLRSVLTQLAAQLVGREEWAGRDRRERDEVLRDLIRDRAIRAAVNDMWPYLTAPDLLEDLYADPRRIARAGAALDAHERDLLRRAPGSPWTASDVPLLDEAAELLGGADPWAGARARHAAAEAKREQRYASQVLEGSAASAFVTAGALAERYGGTAERGTLAEAALDDRTWSFGHVVVDEAQELSWMDWRLLARRCPSRSMTVVGDLAQGAAAWAPHSWTAALADHVGTRVEVAELTIGYRTPAAVMRLAARVLALLGTDLTAPRAVREGTHPPRQVQAAPGTLPSTVADAVLALRREDPAARLAVIAPDPGVLAAVLRAALGDDLGDSTDAAVALLSVAGSKGLEFDGVVVVSPEVLLTDGPRGPSGLYVALTRSTDRLVLISEGPLPEVLQA